MSGWTARRFWTEATVEPCAGGWEVRLDGRAIRTPAKNPLILPTRALADAVAAEWAAQDKVIVPASMPLTRAANAAIDNVAPQHGAVVEMLAAYGETDLLCHRAEAPADLVRRQAEAWDPLLSWAAEALSAPLRPVAGVIAQPQPVDSLSRLRGEVAALDAFRLTAFHDLVVLSGSLILALAVLKGQGPAEALWRASRIDEHWQAELWGQDEEAAAAEETKRQDFLRAVRLLALLETAT